MAPRILIFSIAMGAEYLSYVKSIATFALTLYGHIILVLASTCTNSHLHKFNALSGLKIWLEFFTNSDAMLNSDRNPRNSKKILIGISGFSGLKSRPFGFLRAQVSKTEISPFSKIFNQWQQRLAYRRGNKISVMMLCTNSPEEN